MGPGGKNPEPKPEAKPEGKKPKGPQPPKLPEDPKDPKAPKVPQELRDFVDCKGTSATLSSGKIDWLDLPGGIKPDVKIEKGEKEGTFKITASIDVGIKVDFEMPAEVKDGKLVLDTSKVPGKIPGVGNPKKSVDDWVKKLNDWMAHNKNKFGDATLKGGKLTLTKVKETAMVAPGGWGGWGTGKKVAAGLATVAVLTGVGAGVYALTNDGGGGTDTVVAGPPDSMDQGNGTFAARLQAFEQVPPETLEPQVYAGTICLVHGTGMSNEMIPFSVGAARPGTSNKLFTFGSLDGVYMARFADGPTGAVSGEGQVTNGRGLITIPITSYGTYTDLTITGPQGQEVALGPLADQVPFEVTSSEVDCPDASTLETAPVAPGSEGLTDFVNTEFIDPFNMAVKTADSDYLVSILHPAVIERYGKAQCQSSLNGFVVGAGLEFSPAMSVTGPAPYDWATDGRTATVDDTYTVEVEATSNGETQPRSIHITPVDDHFAFYSDCGDVM